MKPTVILVGADKGGVGKTTVSRVLLDYLAGHNVLTRAFDTEFPRGTLMRFHPEAAEVVDITNTTDQMRVLDTLNTSQVKVSVIDTRAGGRLRQERQGHAAAAGEFNFIIFHLLGPSIASLDEIAEVARFVTNARYFLVKNYINDTTFFEWDPSTYASYFSKVKCAGEITVPKLNATAYEQVEIAGVPFSTFVSNRTREGTNAEHSFVLRGYVRSWLAQISQELSRIHLLDLIASKAT